MLAVRRPEDDEDLPGHWGLPAASLREEESWEEAVLRTGPEKLGLELAVGPQMNEGRAEVENQFLRGVSRNGNEKAKALVADGAYAMLGSANLDYRSLHLNFETNVEVGDRTFARTVREQVEEEIAASREVELRTHLERPLPRRLAENFFLLFQPVL